MAKIKQSETKIIMRSGITPADYNPRKITEEARKALKKNIKENGIIGGIVFNENTGNLISGHQRISVADEINKFNSETLENDYEIKVEVINVDLKKEKELNIFFNSKAAQGEYDYSKLANLIHEIDVDLAGLDAVDLSMIEVEMPKELNIEIPIFNPQAKKIEDQIDKELSDEEKNAKKEHVKAVKETVKNNSVYEGDPYITLSFDNYENKVFFLERFNISGDTKIIKGEEFADLIDGK